jgi:flagellar biosynthesis regulator FlbT
MPLKIRIKPEEKFYAGGAVLKNVGSHPADLLILSDSPVLRDNYLMNVDERSTSDAAEVYFLLQILYLFKGKGQPLDGLVIQTIRQFAKVYPNLQDQVDKIIQHLEAGEAFKALRLGHDILALGRVGDKKADDKSVSDKNKAHMETGQT